MILLKAIGIRHLIRR